MAAIKADNGFVLYADEFNMGPVNVPVGNAIWKPSWGTLIPKKGPTKPSLLHDGWAMNMCVKSPTSACSSTSRKARRAAPKNLPDPSTSPRNAPRPIRDQDPPSGRRDDHRQRPVLGGGVDRPEGVPHLVGDQYHRCGVAHLRFLPKLRMVDINLSSLTDEAVRHLSKLPALEDLHLQGKKFSDQSLLHLSRAKSLKSLCLMMDVSEISDEGLKHLEGLSNLRRLHLSKSKLSNEAKERLLKAIPGLEIVP